MYALLKHDSAGRILSVKYGLTYKDAVPAEDEVLVQTPVSARTLVENYYVVDGQIAHRTNWGSLPTLAVADGLLTVSGLPEDASITIKGTSGRGRVFEQLVSGGSDLLVQVGDHGNLVVTVDCAEKTKVALQVSF